MANGSKKNCKKIDNQNKLTKPKREEKLAKALIKNIKLRKENKKKS